MARIIAFTPEGWDDYQFWMNQDRKTLRKLHKLIADTQRDPFNGLGKPEPLKENYAGFWSRRIDEKNRFVYAVTEKEIQIISCRFHY
ncbi:MAG TPA: Txe/YoeB family addiction module toxin [Verrucomicrobiae bacterium]|nr:Txe/YoeB family addiction module toxin [Verrucomicrobiae bacterium]